VTDPEGELFQAELDFGAGEGEAFTRDVYQRCAAAVPPCIAAAPRRRPAPRTQELPPGGPVVHSSNPPGALAPLAPTHPHAAAVLACAPRYGVFSSHEEEEVDAEQPQ
jgi:hypothetical protein